MKKIIALSLFLCVILSSCSFNKSVNNDTGSNNIQERQATDVVGSEDEDVPEYYEFAFPVSLFTDLLKEQLDNITHRKSDNAMIFFIPFPPQNLFL